MTRATQERERSLLNRERPSWASLSEIQRARILLYRGPQIVHDPPDICRLRLQSLELAIHPGGAR